ncbi:hypothetical protein KCP78_22875 [Salmonella enterica subsp. enterica]|nr:hypothetical protein KCP78_22875 [Salmonella enterica subsp. enterica]
MTAVVSRIWRGSSKHWRRYSGVPVWSSLTDEYHLTQLLADLPCGNICRVKQHNEMTLWSMPATRVITWGNPCWKPPR